MGSGLGFKQNCPVGKETKCICYEEAATKCHWRKSHPLCRSVWAWAREPLSTPGPEQPAQRWVGIQSCAEMGWWESGVGVKEVPKVTQG